MSTRRLLGPFVTDFAIRRAIVTLLSSRHLGVYTDEIVRQQAGDSFARVPRVQDVIAREAPGKLAEHQLPALVVRCPDHEVTYRDSDGSYTVRYRVEIQAITQSSSADGLDGAEDASIVALAAAGFVLQALTAFDSRVQSVAYTGGGSADGIPEGQDRSRHGSVRALDVTVRDVLSDLGGPLPFDLDDPPIDEPPADPGDLPTIDDTDATAEPVEEIETA